MTDFDPNKMPEHVAIIMDGNGRWAKERGKIRFEGHRAGIESVRKVINAAEEIGVKYLTLYTFSEENWQRPRPEVEGLMRLLNRFLKAELNQLHKKNVRIIILGEIDRLPNPTRQTVKDSVERTALNTGLNLSLALSYGGRQEILRAVKSLAADSAAGAVNPDDIDQDLFAARLYTEGRPDPDLMIRTGGDNRISNFLLWQLAYSELYIMDVKWPDFRKEHLIEAVVAFQQRQRRFGKTEEQLKK